MKILIQKITIMLLLSLITNISFSQTTPDPYYDVQSYENGDPLYYKHQIIIAFSPELLKKSVIDNKEFVNGNLSDFFTSEAITLAQSIGIWNSNIAVAPTSKIYRSLDSDDTLSLTRNGETITIPKYWATLLVFWPLSDETPILQICDSLKTFYPIIEFAHPNYLYKLNSIPNDVHYQSDQFNLHPNTNWTINGNIEIENAWSIETGSPDIKLGIYDAPIIYSHEDFGGGTLLSSKIKGGRVYYDGLSSKPIDISAFTLSTTYSNHGTNVAGIAAAIRNNDIGIAGVAGGDFANVIPNVGTSLYTFGIFGDNNQTKSSSAKASDARISEAIIDGANYILQPNGSYIGYGLDIQNHSWGRDVLTDNVRRAIKGAARNKCVVVCSRGNDNDAANKNGTTTNNYPSTYNDEWVISVGASGTNKKRLNIFDKNVGTVPNTQYPSGTPREWSSMYGKGMDVLAPGAQSLLITTHNDNVPAYDYYCQVNKYCYFNGTSAAAPHVSGLAALLLSKYRPINGFFGFNKLEPEDVENLIEKYAMHHAPAPSFYSAEQGWGLINPDNTLDKIRDNRYKIHHFTNGGTKTQTGLGNMNITIPAGGAFGLGAGTYTVYRWKIEENYNLTFGTNEQILGYWPRLNSTFGLNDFGALAVTEDDYAKYDFTLSGNSLNVKATTYAYYYLPLNKWLYLHKDNVATAFSVHTFDPTASAVNETVLIKTDLKLYPNPASNYVNIDLNGLKMNSFQLFDINGKQQIVPISLNAKGLEINTATLVQGFNICKTILSNGSVAINKILITK
jgi:hypothetical protein